MKNKKIPKYPELVKIKGRSREFGFTYRDLSEKTGIKLRRLSDLLNGHYQIHLDEALKIANVLHIATDDIPIFFALIGA